MYQKVMSGAQDFSVGIAKGGIETAIGTAGLVQNLGQRGIAAIDPTRTLDEVREQTGFPSLKGDQATEIREQLKAKNPTEKAGKVVEFLAEIIYPVGRAQEVSSLVSKGKKTAGAVFDTLKEKAALIGDDVVDAGVKVKDRLVEVSSKLDEKTKTALGRTPKELFDEVVEKGKAAMKDDRVVTPIEEVGQRFVEAARSIKNRMDQIGKQKSEVLNQAKTAYQDVSKFVREAILDIQKQLGNLGPEDQKYANEIIERLKPYMKVGRLKDVDALIDDIQDGLYKLADSEKAVQLTDRVTGIIRGSIEGMNRKLQTKVGGAYADLNRKYSEMIKILNDVNRSVGKRGERAGAFMKQFFSPSGMTAKRLIEQMEKITGIDFSRDARLAKFVMETLGDRRVESILEQIPKNIPRSAVDAGSQLLEWVMKKTGIKDPIEAARKFIENQVD